MHNKIFIIYWYLTSFCLFVFSINSLTAQAHNNELNELTSKNHKHSVNIEIGGRTMVFGSLNYEYKFYKNASVGFGLGFINMQKGNITRSINGLTETGKYFETATTQMLYGNYFIGENKHKLFFTAGLTNFLYTNRNKYPSNTEFSADLQFKGNAGIGYQLLANRKYFRITAYGLALPSPSSWFPDYIPWLGIAAGLNF